MFEGSLVESRGLVDAGARRWTALGSLTVQCAVAGLLILVPMLKPEMLPQLAEAPHISVPYLVKPPVVVPVRPTATASTSPMSVPAAGPVPVATGHPFVFPRPAEATDGLAPAVGPLSMSGNGPMLSVLGTGVGTAPVVIAARPKEIGPVHVSTGVSQGLLLTPIQPVYPPIAKATGTQGTVVLEAVISKAGRIESLRTVSGSPMLAGAAVQAVSMARYRPYLLNGEPVAVQTTITVVFRLGS